jgi:AcrR family transcriptional regulator
MSTTARNPRAARSIKRIVDAAARLFGTEGYRGASMNAVARAAGVSKALLHYHFDSKHHLLIEAQRAAFRQIHKRFDDRFSRGERGLRPALDAIDALWESLRDMRAWGPFMVEMLSLEAGSPEPSPHVAAFYDESMGLLERGVRDVFADHLDDLGMPPDRLASVVRAGMHGMIVELANARSEEDLVRLDQTYRDLRGLFEDAIAARIASARPG